jgi:plasmid maintenance system antidote protein VapI
MITVMDEHEKETSTPAPAQSLAPSLAIIQALRRYYYHDARGERSEVLEELNRSALAMEIGIHRSQLSRILSGKIEPPTKTLRRMAEVLGSSLDEVDTWLRGIRDARARVREQEQQRKQAQKRKR